MTEIAITKLIFGILLSIGSLVLIFLAYKLFFKYLVQEKKCTAKTKGIVKKYTLSERGGDGSGLHLPIVYYEVDDRQYKVVGPEYKKYIITTKENLSSKNELHYEVNNDTLIIHKNVNSLIGVHRNPMRELFPLDSEIDVFYDPTNPKLSYVLRYCNQKWGFWLMFITGVIVLAIDISMLLLM